MIINSGFEKCKDARNDAGNQHMQLPSDKFGKLEGLDISRVSKKLLESHLEVEFIP